MTEWPDIVFRVPANELSALRTSLAERPEVDYEVVPVAGAAGSGDLVTVLVQLTPAALTFLGGVATAWIAKPRATVEIGGLKATGLSAQVVAEILRRELAKTDAPGKDTG